jgi:hypothetical protein
MYFTNRGMALALYVVYRTCVKMQVLWRVYSVHRHGKKTGIFRKVRECPIASMTLKVSRETSNMFVSPHREVTVCTAWLIFCCEVTWTSNGENNNTLSPRCGDQTQQNHKMLLQLNPWASLELFFLPLSSPFFYGPMADSSPISSI